MSHDAMPDPASLATRLSWLMPRLLTALPADWAPEATTYDLPRFHSEAEFMARFEAALARIEAENIQDPAALRALLADCGHPYDYARLGHPLSTIYEAWLQALSGAGRVISFASRTKPFLALIEARMQPQRPVALYAETTLPLTPAHQQALEDQGVALHEGWQGPLPAPDGSLRVLISEARPESIQFSAAGLNDVDAVCCPLAEGGVLLIAPQALEAVDSGRLQVLRKRTVAALLAADARYELRRLAGLPLTPAPKVTVADCDELLRALFPEITASAYFCTGLAAEAAVFAACAELLSPTAPLRLFYAQNGYGGSGQLITDVLARQSLIDPTPLPVLSHDAQGKTLSLVDKIVAGLEGLAGAPAAAFLETPTNPELQVHDFARLMTALRAYHARHGVQIPVLVDTTLAPLYPILGLDFAADWPFLVVKSGSKYFTKGKAILGLAFCGDDALARQILNHARGIGSDEDSFAKSSQLAALADGLRDLRPRMASIAAHTTRLAEELRALFASRGHAITLYAMNPDQLAAGLASGILSFYLPPAPSTHADLVDEFVDHLLQTAPDLVKNRVSYGQSSGGPRDPFYVINPEESTQGSLPEAVKAAQKKDNVQICRISVPEHADVAGLMQAITAFVDLKYPRD